ncbi:MAG: arginase family protein [Pseudomonadota bacterium]
MGAADRVPSGTPVYVTIDIDGFDPSIAPGTGTPSHGGFLYYEVLELLHSTGIHHGLVFLFPEQLMGQNRRYLS